MKQSLLIISLLISMIISPAFAQTKGRHLTKEEFRNKQKDYLTDKAKLTEEEAQKFFPIYFEFHDKKAQYNKNIWTNMRRGNNENTTETEYSQITEDIIRTKITINNLELEYLEKYKKILSSKKIYNIQKAEFKFHKELIKQMKESEKKNNK